MVRSLAEARACAAHPPYDFFGSWSGDPVLAEQLDHLAVQRHRDATSAQTRDMRTHTLVQRQHPSFLMSSDRQCSESGIWVGR